MLELKDLQTNFAVKEKVIKIKAWNGEVKIRELTTKERSQIVEVMQGDSIIDEKGSTLKLSNLTKAQILTAHYGLVEPSLSTKDIESLSESAFEGIKEINEAIEGLSKKN
ncbi:hypothetical protein [Campylobacter ureolyticus]|uniref:Uncharacterized protein n=1 Tax=Campylobacter ureolyticus TaxID=827 RepID=A0AAE7EAD3_9BACT|nr:hypothetical protein [Campylobacter ureolyticus]MCR8685219.1 hypothetical protein [Campylobacter ureolyticus]QKF84554.1 hypothetical protein CURT_1076 [Campylobacter ureolyticus]QQY35284.1 hypothetical protein I6I59_07135 [Campylobacter ureolyticus]SUX22216.1 Uncharacterised protein [Campylobacter ureolyticus]